MRKAKLKMGNGEDCWDKLSLIFEQNKSLAQFVRLKDRYSALGLYNELFCAYVEGQRGDLSLEIDGESFSLSYDCWSEVLSCLDQWFEDYMRLVEGVDKDG